MTNYLSMQLVSTNPLTACVVTAINQGIDSRLEGFTRSKFEWMAHYPLKTISLLDTEKGDVVICVKLHCRIHPCEVQTLLRRLSEQKYDDKLQEGASELIDWILENEYGVENDTDRIT